MLAHALVILALAGPGLAARVPDLAQAGSERLTAAIVAVRVAGEEAARFAPAERRVTNWRREAASNLEPGPLAALAALLQAERPVVSRCVKLNNYWCIKSARWDGEIGTDEEGHVGFATAEQGADAAATLLRRYYLDFGRHSALDIVRRWAPPECGLLTLSGGLPLAVRGIQGTVRARYLAGRRVRFTATSSRAGRAGVSRGAPAPRVSVVIPRAVPAFRVPDIAAGMGERPAPAAPVRPAAGPPATGSVASAPQPACGFDERRIQNYAAHIVEGLGVKPADDLKLFAEDRTPLPNLEPVMRAMSAVELGILRASVTLVSGAIERTAADAVRPVGPEPRVDGAGAAP
jgi:hypothetical protein